MFAALWLLTFAAFSLTVIAGVMLISARDGTSVSQGYILCNRVTHARLLPKDSSHSFVYPTLAIFVSLNALESNHLDLVRGWLFGYGSVWGSLIGLRSSGYLTRERKDGRTIKEKLKQLLSDRGCNGNILDDAWMLTMPSYFGIEGINPLTVYFCYNSCGELWAVILEVHNTFGEQHVHVLQIGIAEDDEHRFDHQWTFRREFHVSPFNDRAGFYTVSVSSPSHPPNFKPESSNLPSPHPIVRIRLHNAKPDAKASHVGPLKLVAILRTTTSVPLTSHNLLATLVRYPFALFLSFPRILYHAWILHFRKRLDVYPRPDPHPAVSTWGTCDGDSEAISVSGGVGWQPESLLERLCRRRVEEFLRNRASETGITVTLIPADPATPSQVFAPSSVTGKHCEDSSARLKISYLSPRFFTVLTVSPSPEHALLLGAAEGDLFKASSQERFVALFSPATRFSADEATEQSASLQQCIRGMALPAVLRTSPAYPVPTSHPLDGASALLDMLRSTCLLLCLLMLAHLEKWTFNALGARFVPGMEPWGGWERAVRILQEVEYNQRE